MVARLLVLFFIANPLCAAEEATNELLPYMEAASINGASGMALSPNAYAAPFGVLLAGFHRYDIKLGMGLIPGLEAGVKKRFELNSADFLDQSMANAKFQVFHQKSIGFDLAGGVEMPTRDVSSAYMTAGYCFENLWRGILILAGWGTERFKDGFGSAGVVVYPGAMMLGEYNGRDINAGFRVLLSDRYKLDFFMLALNRIKDSKTPADILQNNVVFGVSYSEAFAPGF
jgi:hypothetical protein